MIRKVVRKFNMDLKSIKADPHFTNYNQYPTNVDHFRNQLIYRSSNLGMLELDYLIGNWAKKYIKTMEYPQLIAYDQQVLGKETPELFKMLIQAQSDQKLQDEYKDIIKNSEYLQKLVLFGIRGEAAEDFKSQI